MATHLSAHFWVQDAGVVRGPRAAGEEGGEEQRGEAGLAEILPRQGAQLLQHRRGLSTLHHTLSGNGHIEIFFENILRLENDLKITWSKYQ